MTSDVESPRPDQNPAPAVAHGEFAHDQPVSLRQPAPQPTPQFGQPQQPAQQSEVQLPAVSAQPEPPQESFAATGFEQFDGEPQQPMAPVPDLAWTASEFVHHPKDPVWYLALGGVTLLIAALAYLFTQDIVTPVVIALCGGIFGYAASRQPRQLHYGLDSQGVTIGVKHYLYKDFRSFAVIPEGAFSSIDFMPLKRFSPVLSIYYDPEHEPHVMELLAQHLPMAQHKRTMIDDLMARIRF